MSGASRPVTYVGLGSNLDSPERQIRTALVELAKAPGVIGVRGSSLYANPPMGPADQPDYVNAVAEVITALEPLALLDLLQSIEAIHGRVRKLERWGPRTLDLDLLVYADQRIDCDRLSVPHPGIAERSFVLLPLYELAPELKIPGLGPVSALLTGVESTELHRLG